jgi:hypothetical protein
LAEKLDTEATRKLVSAAKVLGGVGCGQKSARKVLAGPGIIGAETQQQLKRLSKQY